MNSQVHQQPKVPTQTGETKKKSTSKSATHCSKAAQLVKRQIESKSKVDNKPRNSEEDDTVLVSKYRSNPHQQHLQLSSMRKQRLMKKQQWASTNEISNQDSTQNRLQESAQVEMVADCRPEKKTMAKDNKQHQQLSQQYLVGQHGSLTRPEQTSPTKKTTPHISNNASSSLKSTRLRHFQSNPHQVHNQGHHQSSSQSNSCRQSQRISKGFANHLNKFSQVVQQSNSLLQDQQVSSARNDHLRDSFKFKDGLISNEPTVTSQHQLVMTDLHSTKAVVQNKNYRYRTEQISKMRQRPTDQDVIKCHSVSSEERETPFTAAQQPAHHIQNSHQGRLLFKRQEKNAGFSQRGQMQAPQVVYHPPQEHTCLTTNGVSNSSSQISLKVLNHNHQLQFSNSKIPATQRNSIQSNPLAQNQQQLQQQPKLFIGENKRETHLLRSKKTTSVKPDSQNHLALPSPTNEQRKQFQLRTGANVTTNNSKKNTQVHTTKSQLHGQREPLNLNYNKTSKEIAVPQGTLKSNRSLRRITQQYPHTASSSVNELAANSPRSFQGNRSNVLASFKTNAATSKAVGNHHRMQTNPVIDRISSQQAITSQMMMNIREEYSERKFAIKPNHRDQKLSLNRQSIPVISTKHFLESEQPDDKNDGAISERQTEQLVSSASNQNEQLFYDQTRSIDARSQSKHGRNGSKQGSALHNHQHSSSVLPSHRHRHLLYSVNVLPLQGITTETPSQLQHYGSSRDNKNQTAAPGDAPVTTTGIDHGHHQAYRQGQELQQQQTRFNTNPTGFNNRYLQKKEINSARQLSHPQQIRSHHTSVQEMSVFNGANCQSSRETTTPSGSIVVSKVQQKSQQFKFQFRRKSQQSKNFQIKNQHRAGATTQNDNEMIENNGNGPQQQQTTTTTGTEPQGSTSHRQSASTKAQPSFRNHLYAEQQRVEEDHDQLRHHQQHPQQQPEEAIYNSNYNGRQHKSNRNHKLLSSESPPHNKRGALQHGKQYHRALKKQNAYHPSANVSDGSDFTNMVNQVNSRGRLQSVAIQPSSFSKRLVDPQENPQEKMITSSQNSGGNISGLTLAPAQKPPNTPLKQSMQSMHPNQKKSMTSNDENTTQKMGHRRNTVYDNMLTKKRHEIEVSSLEPKSSNRTQKRVVQQFQMSSGATTSQEGGSSSDYQQSLPSINGGGGVSKKRKLSRNPQQMINSDSQVILSGGTKVTSYVEQQNPSQTGFPSKSNIAASVIDATSSGSEQCPYIIRSTTTNIVQATTKSNPTTKHGGGGAHNRYQNLDESSAKQTTFDMNNGQSFSVYRSNDDGATSNGGSANGGITDTASKVFATGNSLHSAINIVSCKDRDHQQLSSIEPINGLSKTSSLNNFQHAYTNRNHKLKQQSQKNKNNVSSNFKVEVYSDKQSANEIARLQDQIKKREHAYTNLKVQFEQLRQQVAKKHRNASHESAPVQFETNEKNKYQQQVESGQQSFDDEDGDDDIDSVSAFGTGLRTRFHDPMVKKTKDVVRSSLNDQLQLIKQRSNSEAHLQHLTVPLRTINEQQTIAGHSKQSVKSVHRTPGQKKESKLRQPTKFNGKHKDGGTSLISHTNNNVSNFSLKSSANSSINPDLLAPHVVELLKKKTSKYQQLASQSPVRRERQFSSRRTSLQGQNIAHHNRYDSKTSRLAGSDGSCKGQRIAGKNTTAEQKAKASRFSSQMVQGRIAAPQKQKHVTQNHSTVSLERSNLTQITQTKQINKIKKQQLAYAAAPQKKDLLASQATNSVVQKAQQQKAKTTTSKNNANIGVQGDHMNNNSIDPMLGTLSQTNKLAIQNLKQVINSTGKKMLSKKRQSSMIQQSQISQKVTKQSPYQQQQQSTIVVKPHQQQVGLNEDLDVIQTEVDVIQEEDDDIKLAIDAQASFGGQQIQQHQMQSMREIKIDSNRFKSSAAEQIDHAGEDQVTTDQESPIIKQESMFKEETPSNEQSQQNSMGHPPIQIVNGLPLNSEESKEFKTTGTAFGTNNNSNLASNKSRQSMLRAAQEVNCFGIHAAAANSASGLEQVVKEQSSAIFPNKIDISQQSATFANNVSGGANKQDNSSSISQKQASIGQQSSVAVVDDPSRCDTPIHPNQVVDGIKFMDVQDPTYKSSAVFEQCYDDDDVESTKQFIKQDQDSAPRQATPMIAMNSTGKEFFANKNTHTGQSSKPVSSLQSQPQQVQTQIQSTQLNPKLQVDEKTAAQIQKSSIQILKQLQKKKQGMANQQNLRKSVHHPKVVISQNNPFFLKQNKQPNAGAYNSNQSNSQNNNYMIGTRSSGEFVAAQTNIVGKSNVTGTHQPMMISKQVSSDDQSGGPPQDSVNQTASLGHLLGQQQSSSTSGENTIGGNAAKVYSQPVLKQNPSGNSSFAPPAVNYEASVVSHEIFYSPIQGEDDPHGSIEEDKNEIVEVLPQYSYRVRPAPDLEKHGSDAAQMMFGGRQQVLLDHQNNSIEVSQIEHHDHVKRDEILDDSLLFALQSNEQPKNVDHLDDSCNEEGNVDIEIQDQDNFFAQQMALQPEIIRTPISSKNSDPEYIEKSNMADLIPTTEGKKRIGDGLILDEQRGSNLSNEMAALDPRNEASPGFKKKQLDMNPDTNKNYRQKVLDYIDDAYEGKHNAATPSAAPFALTDQKRPDLMVHNKVSQTGSKPENLLLGNMMPVPYSSKASARAGVLQHTNNNNNMINSGSKLTMTDMVVSNANLTYSAESSPDRAAASNIRSVSDWTGSNMVGQPSAQGHLEKN